MTRQLRKGGGKIGLILANGGWISYQNVICLSSSPRSDGLPYPDQNPLPEFVTDVQVPAIEEVAEGDAIIETYTVDFGRDGTPTRGHIVGRLKRNGHRFLANHADARTLQELCSASVEPIGRTGRVNTDGKGRNLFTIAGDLPKFNVNHVHDHTTLHSIALPPPTVLAIRVRGLVPCSIALGKPSPTDFSLPIKPGACGRRSTSISMVLAREADYDTISPSSTHSIIDDDTHSTSRTDTMAGARRTEEGLRADMSGARAVDIDDEAYRPPYIHAMLAGGLGGTVGDMLMHSLDTVKTRQQGDPHMPPKYTSMGNTYYTIFRQEGLWRGLYGGVTPAFLGSFGGTLIFFGCYEWSKRQMIDHGVAPSMAYFASGFVADLAASPLYVPTEVLKTRLQLQGRYNNPFFSSGYNYRSSMHAIRTIYRAEGLSELFSGYKATLSRDLPFSALQFAFYEQEQKLAKQFVGPGKDIGLPLEILTGATAGGMAGIITCPLDVVKTRIQTELDPDVVAAARNTKKGSKASPSVSASAPAPAPATPSPSSARRPSPTANVTDSTPKTQRVPISTSGPSTALKQHGQVPLDTESVIKALRIIYRTEGLAGWFRGVGPRAVWTSVQSGTMLVVYQHLIKWFDGHPLVDGDEGLRGWG
nr:putative mitochondrial carrier [Quercus suber]POE94784.1 putative mitochondrial carrier [Quercus suber]